MNIKILHHSLRQHNEVHQYDEYNTKLITCLIDMPKLLSISCNFMEYIALQYNQVIVILLDMPGRIDYDRYLNNLYILSTKETGYCQKPYCLIPEQRNLSSTLWELGEREQVTLEEVGILTH